MKIRDANDVFPKIQEEQEQNSEAHRVLVAIQRLAALGLLYGSGERRDGQIVWKATPAVYNMTEGEIDSLLADAARRQLGFRH